MEGSKQVNFAANLRHGRNQAVKMVLSMLVECSAEWHQGWSSLTLRHQTCSACDSLDTEADVIRTLTVCLLFA